MTNPSRGMTPTKIIEKQWEGISGAILHFPVRMALSSELTKDRESNLTLKNEERAAKLPEFRIKVLADVLTSAPYLIWLSDLTGLLEKKQAEAIEGIENAEEAARVKSLTRLTQEEVDALKKPFPDFPETTPETLAEKAREYFGQKDERGGEVFRPLVEDVIEDYWYWVNPRPTISVSAFTQGK